MSIISSIASSCFVNKTVRINETFNGRDVLLAALNKLQERLPGQREEILNQANTMRIAVGEVLTLALNDFHTFCKHWNISVSVWNSNEETNIFIFKLSERNACPRDFEFRFTRLA